MTDQLSAEPQASVKEDALTVVSTSAQTPKPASRPLTQPKIEPSPDPQLVKRAFDQLAPLYKNYQSAGSSYKKASATVVRSVESRNAAKKQLEAARIALGKSLLKWRDEFSAQGNRDGKGFAALLDRIGFPRATAYRHIERYENVYLVSDKANETKSLPPKPRSKPAPVLIEATATDATACMQQVTHGLEKLIDLAPTSDPVELRRWYIDLRARLREIEAHCGLEPDQGGVA
jgi:hypothetical protein